MDAVVLRGRTRLGLIWAFGELEAKFAGALAGSHRVILFSIVQTNMNTFWFGGARCPTLTDPVPQFSAQVANLVAFPDDIILLSIIKSDVV
jgi:hypothetical protein